MIGSVGVAHKRTAGANSRTDGCVYRRRAWREWLLKAEQVIPERYLLHDSIMPDN